MLNLKDFCSTYNSYLKTYYDYFGDDLEREQLESEDINSYFINQSDFYLDKDLNDNDFTQTYKAVKNDIQIALNCYKNDTGERMVVSVYISKVDKIDTASNELIKRIYLPFLSAMTGKDIDNAINIWLKILDDDNWETEDELKIIYKLTNDYSFCIALLEEI